MMVRDTLRGIKLEATQEPLTAQGGAVAFLEYMRAMKRGERAKDVLPAPGSNRGYGPEVYVNAFVALFALGGKSLADLRELGRERPPLSLLEQERIPNEDTAGNGSGVWGIRTRDRTTCRDWASSGTGRTGRSFPGKEGRTIRLISMRPSSFRAKEGPGFPP